MRMPNLSRWNFSSAYGSAQQVLLLLVLSSLCLMAGCTKIPEGLQPVHGFQLERFLGAWYEIARLDHGFERGLDQVTAQYTQREDGSVTVLNRGFNEKTGKWEEAEGVARFISEKDVGSLKVSFFGPFYGGYHIIDLDSQNYRYAMVTGPSRNFLWILARDRTLDDKTLAELIAKAGRWGFDTKKLIFVKHTAAESLPTSQQPEKE